MAGSRKGEKRGGRKAGIEPKPHGPRVRAERAKIDPIETARKDPNINAPGRTSGRGVATEEYYRQLTQAMLPERLREIEPREVMLEAMRYFHTGAMKERVLLQQQIESLPDPSNMDARWEDINRELLATAGRAERLHTMATDTAFKVAPYMHAKLSSVEMKVNDGSQLNIIQVLMSEISGGAKSKPAWMDELSDGHTIEHAGPQVGEET